MKYHSLFLSKIRKYVAKFVICCSCDWRFRVKGFSLSVLAKLPKNYDPDVIPDAERWLPRRERSYYRGKRKDKKRDIG